MKKHLPILLAIALVVGGGAFYGGMKYAQAKSPRMMGGGQFFATTANGPSGGGMMGGSAQARAGGGRQGGGAGFIGGEILSSDGKTLTIKMRDGGSKIVLLGDSTEVSKFVAGSSTDLEIGKTVMVVGKTNDDGSVTAQSIQLRPAAPVLPNGATAPTDAQPAPKPSAQ